MFSTTRRGFLASVAAGGLTAAASQLLPRTALAADPTTIRIDTRIIEVLGRPAKVFALHQPNGKPGLTLSAGERFRVRLQNDTDEASLIHWHGLTPPVVQDGVPAISQPLLRPGESYDYDFDVGQPGTHWMHSHHGMQEQRLLAAPLLVLDPGSRERDSQDVVVLLHDFTFRDPAEILAELTGGAGTDVHAGGGAPPAAAPDHRAMGHGAPSAAAHLHDVDYDAFLANERTLDDPEVVRVERRGRVRLRLINGASATNFWIDTGQLEATLIAVDGQDVHPVAGRRFELAIAQRIDLAIALPAAEGAWPVFALREGEMQRTGIVLATPNGEVRRIGPLSEHAPPAVGLDLERKIRALRPLVSRAPDRSTTMAITEGPGYRWMLAEEGTIAPSPVPVTPGERVELTFVDRSTMAHPIHLHGHHFQVVAINGERFPGAVRDTVLVPSKGSVTVAFDASNPGEWALHCHHLYHMAAGMMTTLIYEG